VGGRHSATQGACGAEGAVAAAPAEEDLDEPAPKNTDPPPSDASASSTGARAWLKVVAGYRTASRNTTLPSVSDGVSAGAWHQPGDKDKVIAHLDALMDALRVSKTDAGNAKTEARELRQQIDAKQAEIDDLKPQVEASMGANDDLEQELVRLRRESEESRKETAAAVNYLRRHGNKLAFKKLLPVKDGGDADIRKNARQLTGFSSAEAFVAMLKVLNHDGASEWMKTWQLRMRHFYWLVLRHCGDFEKSRSKFKSLWCVCGVYKSVVGSSNHCGAFQGI